MSIVLCTREDLDGDTLPVNMEFLDEEECQRVVVAVRNFFASFLDTRPYHEAGVLSMRAENILRRNHCKTLADVRRLLTTAQSNQGVFGAGRMVQDELAALLR